MWYTLACLTRPATANRRTECFLVRRRAPFFSRFDFFLQLSTGGQNFRLFSARKNTLNASAYTIRIMHKVVGQIYYDRNSNLFQLVQCDPRQETGRRLSRQERQAQSTLDVSIHRSRIRPRTLRVSLPGVNALTFAAASRNQDCGWIEATTSKAQVAPWPSVSNSEPCLQFVNIEPRWDDSLRHYVLRYYGRAKLASVKNVQLKSKSRNAKEDGKLGRENEADVHFLVGKVEDDFFNVDFKHGFSFLTAFALAVVIVDSPNSITF